MTNLNSFASLYDPETCWLDEEAKSIGYFATHPIIRLDSATVEEIKQVALDSGENVRLSLHRSPKSTFHEMIIFQHRNKYYRPKKHINKAKSFHMIEGEMAVFVFDENGLILDSCLLDGKNTLIYRVAANMFHTDVPLSKYVVHHESTLGPFEGDNDRVFGSWSPDGSDEQAYLAYRDRLVSSLALKRPA